MEIKYYKKIFNMNLPEQYIMFNYEINNMIFLLKNKISFIPKILKVKITKNNKEIFYERIVGKTLKEMNILNYSLKERLKIFNEIIVVVEKIHNLGLIHNDINLGNIIINENNVYIIDFSESRFINNKYDKKYFSYTKGFSCLEKYSNNEKNFIENDTYSLTSICYYLVFNKIYPNIRDSNYINIIHSNKKLENFLKKGLSFTKYNRYNNTLVMKEMISDIIEELQ
ncbi:protein kinase domain-containing protein [Streptobacillus moniliformis]|uniref:protein kinase domain-containing protein n=1 Tax=Streptobacillus moniliformis TaxID=34105 RepID=UPI0007E41510|nr:RIO1 family regulatory kinase/ATPase [Streptobacillus moniliformis]